jgi:nucleotide-binding universal stress UspA family protein
MKILLAFDGSEHARAALEEIARRPWPRGTEVKVVTVIEPPFLTTILEGDFQGPLLVEVEAVLRKDATRRVRQALDRLAAREDLKVTSEIRNGSPRREILESVRGWGADLVMAGSRGLGPLGEAVLGSVSHALVSHAQCSVEIVKRPPAPPEAKRRRA